MVDGECVRHPNTESVRNTWESIDGPVGSNGQLVAGYTSTADSEHWEFGEDGWLSGNGGNGIGFPNPADLSEIAPVQLPFLVQGAFNGTQQQNYDATKVVSAENQVFCLTCHKAHGSSNNSSMRWEYQTSSNRGCQQCHNKGS